MLSQESQECGRGCRRQAAAWGELDRAAGGHQPNSRTGTCRSEEEQDVHCHSPTMWPPAGLHVYVSDQTVRNCPSFSGTSARSTDWLSPENRKIGRFTAFRDKSRFTQFLLSGKDWLPPSCWKCSSPLLILCWDLCRKDICCLKLFLFKALHPKSDWLQNIPVLTLSRLIFLF